MNADTHEKPQNLLFLFIFSSSSELAYLIILNLSSWRKYFCTWGMDQQYSVRVATATEVKMIVSEWEENEGWEPG